ncbi:MAG: glucosamine-6-phosphate deaminase [Acidimicrobiia bacterium]|nr:glucosamine-6-phosphate deaminase [Acidimicrobiia bacterium]MYG71121.1 glucosamine-6-phosphate deaminase [Acidimicrobiia bacterium]
MQVFIAKDAAAAAVKAADIVEGVVRSRLRPRIGMATGSTMVGIYRSLVDRYQAGALSFSGTSVYLLDEYVGLEPRHPQAFRNVIRTGLADHVDLGDDAVFGPDGRAPDLEAEAWRYDQLVTKARIDIQLLGIGSNGHIAFNEPGTPFDEPSSVVALCEQTRSDNARFFDSIDDVPSLAITQGIGTILQAKKILLVALGKHKARPIRDALEGPVSVETPASAVQLHADVSVVVDREAASLLSTARPEG